MEAEPTTPDEYIKKVKRNADSQQEEHITSYGEEVKKKEADHQYYK